MITAIRISFWKKNPFFRLLIPFMTGILLQWQFSIDLSWPVISGIVSSALLFTYFFLSPFHRHRFHFFNGFMVFIFFSSLGAIFTWMQDIRHQQRWFGHAITKNSMLAVTIDEPLTEKPHSWKTTASASYLLTGDNRIPVTGKLLLYFKKDSLPPAHFGSKLLLRKPAQEIRNVENPGSFDFKRYALFQGITHQVFLQSADYELLEESETSWLNNMLYSIREWVLAVLRNNITGTKERGLAEALLIGYKDDLDKTLVRSYTNTGVVHIIAISGLHLGLIYYILVSALKPLKTNKRFAWLRPLLIISGLWLFSLLAGAQPSVLRSAVMFSSLVIGDCLARRSSIYNTLAVSAFLILCYNPFWLWDTGFQLSYTAVLSILIFMKPVYGWFYVKNKLPDLFWKLNAVTIAAQVLTLPISIYYFHQFPNYFMLTNIVAVPLSSAILIGEILLCCFSFLPILASIIGKLLGWSIQLMNGWIEKIELLPFSLWQNLQLNLPQTLLFYGCIIAFGYWLMERSVKSLRYGLFILLSFAILRSHSFIQTGRQQKIVVYNISRHRAMDFIDGHRYYFAGDLDSSMNVQLKQYRIIYRVKSSISLATLYRSGNYLSYVGKHILWIEKPVYFPAQTKKTIIDMLLISGNAINSIRELTGFLDIKQVVMDATVPVRRLAQLQKECRTLHIPFHDVTAKGAFVMNIR